jgi:ankyrin repeat protein
MGLSINWTDYKKRTPLHYAAKHGDFLMAELLIKLGGDANPLDYKGRSPAALAEDKGKNYFSKTLASLGGKKIRMVVGKEELKQSREAKNE